MRTLYYSLILLFSTASFASKDYSKLIDANNHGKIETVYLVALAWVESSMRPDVVSHMDCLGLMQIHLDTARDMGFKGTERDLLVPSVNVKYSIKYMYWLLKRYKGRANALYMALDAYNRGIGNVKKWPHKLAWEGHKYVGEIIRKVEQLREKI